jgi:hypothetical protein
MLELRVMNDGQSLPLFDLPAAYGREKAARELGDTIEGLIAFLDDLGGDPDLEDSHDQEADRSDWEPDDDAQGDIAWTEWQSRGRHKADRNGAEVLARDRYGNQLHEDDEDDDPDTGIEDDPRGFDPEEDMCLAGDDRVASGPAAGLGMGWGTDGPGDADDAEREQMLDDVPALAVYSLDHEPFTDQRRFLGISNLQSSFRTNGNPLRSADTGAELRTHHNDNLKPGGPV